MSEDRDDVYALLRSPSSIDRRRAARTLQNRQLAVADLHLLSNLLGNETDPWVRRALEAAVGPETGPARDVTKTPTDDIGWPVDPQTLEDARAQAILDVTRLLLHEIRPMVGVLESAASREVPEFDSSRTRERIERLRSFLDTVERLEHASRPPDPQDFDLSEAVFTAARDVESDPPRVLLARDEPVNSWGDWGLICLCLTNVLRNAVEATDASRTNVVVNWGITDRDSWITVLDEGPGLPTGYDELFTAGFSTKSRKNNKGWGLAIALQAIRSAGGEVTLRPREPRGTGCEIRWPIRGGLE